MVISKANIIGENDAEHVRQVEKSFGQRLGKHGSIYMYLSIVFFYLKVLLQKEMCTKCAYHA